MTGSSQTEGEEKDRMGEKGWKKGASTSLNCRSSGRSSRPLQKFEEWAARIEGRAEGRERRRKEAIKKRGTGRNLVDAA